MKLYTRGQLVVFLSVAFSAAIVLTSIIFTTAYKLKKTHDESVVSVNKSDDSDSGLLKTEDLNLQLNPSDAVPVANSSSYTQDELQNINVYQLCNEAVVNINTQIGRAHV